MTIREIRNEDHSKVIALINKAYRGEESLKGWTTEAHFLSGQRIDQKVLDDELSGPHATMLVLIKDQKMIGCVYLKLFFENRKTYCYLGMLTIDPNLQDKGYGRKLLNAAETFAKEKNAVTITLGVIHLRSELISWYERRGYIQTGKTKDFPYDRAEFGTPNQKSLYFCMMEKKLP